VQSDNATEPYEDLAGGADAEARDEDGAHCPGQKPPFLAVTRPARPYKTAIESRFTVENAKAA
jgi:hypothetical protein